MKEVFENVTRKSVTIKCTPNKIERFFGLKEKTFTLVDIGRHYLFTSDGSINFMIQETGEMYGRHYKAECAIQKFNYSDKN